MSGMFICSRPRRSLFSYNDVTEFSWRPYWCSHTLGDFYIRKIVVWEHQHGYLDSIYRCWFSRMADQTWRDFRLFFTKLNIDLLFVWFYFFFLTCTTKIHSIVPSTIHILYSLLDQMKINNDDNTYYVRKHCRFSIQITYSNAVTFLFVFVFLNEVSFTYTSEDSEQSKRSSLFQTWFSKPTVNKIFWHLISRCTNLIEAESEIRTECSFPGLLLNKVAPNRGVAVQTRGL